MITAIKTTKRIEVLHFEHQLWTSEITFFADELKIYQNRLDEIASKNTGKDVLVKVEHFQNQFIIQKNELATIKHLINEHEQWLTKYAKSHPTSINQVEFADHSNLRDKIEIFKKLYAELKADFMKFLSSYM